MGYETLLEQLKAVCAWNSLSLLVSLRSLSADAHSKSGTYYPYYEIAHLVIFMLKCCYQISHIVVRGFKIVSYKSYNTEEERIE